MNDGRASWAGRLSAGWGVFGFSWILVDAIIRLSILTLEGVAMGLSILQWVLLVVFVIFMAYTEGYRGFQKSFSPRTAARARYLYQRPDLLGGLLAPLFCMGFFRARISSSGVLLKGGGGTMFLFLILTTSPFLGRQTTKP